jgi:hypothetical protein
MNRLHNEDADSDQDYEIYYHRETASYMTIKCKKHLKCKYDIWFKMDKNSNGEPINLVFFRGINQNHCILYHDDSV